VLLFWLSACGATKLRLPGPEALDQPPARVLLILLDAVHEPTFRSLLDEGELPHLARLLEPDPAGKRHGTYTRATSVWPSTTGPAYVPFIAGLYPRKSNLVGIRQYLRELMVFRSYCGSDATIIGDDLTREFPTIYEVLDPRESFNQAGFVSRRGWDDRGRAQKPLHENLNSIPGFIHSYLPPVDDTADLYNALSFVNYVSPEFDHHRIMALGSFEGRYYDWSVPLGTLRLAYEELFSLLGLERVLRELNLDARKLGRLPHFSLISLHMPDVTGHKYGLGAEYEEGLKRVDEIVGFMLEVFRHQGVLEDLTLIVTSDHGLSATERHFPLLERLASDTGVAIHDTVAVSTDDFNLKWRGALGVPGLQQRWAGIGAVSGNANVQIYLIRRTLTCRMARPSTWYGRSWRTRRSLTCSPASARSAGTTS
jgi:predicted AlkP superfamily pyrophosphatase or phosphodiesterase